MKYLVTILGCALFLLSSETVRADDKKVPAPSTTEQEAVAAIFNGKTIKVSDIDSEVSRKPNLAVYLSAAQSNPLLMNRIRHAALDGMINRSILLEEAKKSGAIDENQVKKDVADLMNQFIQQQGGKDQFEESLKSLKTNRAQFESEISDDFRINSFIEKKVFTLKSLSDADLKKEFDKNPDRYAKKEERRARHIIIKLDKGATPKDEAEAKAKIDAIYADLKKPNADFAAIAKEKSQDASAAKGGDLGFFPKGAMVPEFEQVVFSMKPGEMSEPLKTRFGYHIVKLEEVHAAEKPDFQKVKEQVQKTALFEKKSEAVKAKLQELRKKQDIQIKLAALPEPEAPKAPAAAKQ